ncbi:MAG: glycosyltransferase family 1 protein [Candidatus Saccharimonas sp.]
MSHIAIDARVINSGTGTYVVKLLDYLQQIDTTNNYTVLVRAKDVDYWRPTADNFVVKVAEFDNYTFNEQIGFKRFLDKLSPDLVHFCMPQQPVFYKGKRVTTMHDMTLLRTYNSDKNWLVFHVKQLVGRYVWKRIAKISDHVIAISNNTKLEYQKFSHIPDDRISVIYEAGEVTIGKLTESKLPFERFIIYVGQQPDYKNIRRLGEAHQKLLDKFPDLGLALVGRMNPDTIANHKYFEKLGYQNIHFTGYLPDDERDWLYTKAVAYVFPSLMEGFGLPPLEAMAYGAPVVSSSASCLPEVLGEAAKYFDPLDTGDMANSIAEVITDDNLRNDLIKRGTIQVTKYSWRRMAEETHAVYLKALGTTKS